MSRKPRPPLELVSAIGAIGFDLQHYSDREIKMAVDFLRKVNPEMFDWLVKVLASRASQEETER